MMEYLRLTSSDKTGIAKKVDGSLSARELSCKTSLIGARGLGFDYRVGQIGRSVANGLPLLRRFFGTVLSMS